MITSGANDAIYLIAQLYKGWASIIPQPTFTAFEYACKTFDHLISYDRKDELELMPEDRIYWICNPNNPTGNVLVKPLVNRIIRQNPRYLYVVDQSYADYTLRPMLKPSEMVDCYNLMLIGSLSKKYCIPGLRLGYVFSSPIIIDRLRQIRQPWSVNAMALEAGKYVLSNHVQMIPDLKEYLMEAQRLRQELADIDGIKVLKTDTNFMLVFIEFAEVLELKNWLIHHHGILIRDVSDFRFLISEDLIIIISVSWPVQKRMTTSWWLPSVSLRSGKRIILDYKASSNGTALTHFRFFSNCDVLLAPTSTDVTAF